MCDILNPEYDDQTGLPVDESYLECGLPPFLQESLDRMKSAWVKLDKGENYTLWDCDFCELQSNINVAEISGLISEQQAWFLRAKYLRIERPEVVE